MKNQVRKKRNQRDYSLAFKLQVVREVERGELNFNQANRKYGIQGNCTVANWVKKFSNLSWDQLPIFSMKKTPEQRIKELEALLAKEKEKVQVLNIAIDIADEQFNTNIRKKYLPESLKKRKKNP
jgi:transposase-like protein